MYGIPVLVTVTVLIQGAIGSALPTTDTNLGIVGGDNIPIEDAPYMAALLKYNNKTNGYELFCGGSIIHERFILTAAHCLRITDICLLTLKTPLAFGPKVAKLQLPAANLTLDGGTMANVTGWGLNEVSETRDLRQTVPIGSQEYCHSRVVDMVDSMMCTGDSGGPLVYNNTQIGIVSFGPPIWRCSHLSVYTGDKLF